MSLHKKFYNEFTKLGSKIYLFNKFVNSIRGVFEFDKMDLQG